MTSYEERRDNQRRFVRRNLLWLAPLGVIAATGLVIGLAPPLTAEAAQKQHSVLNL